MYITRMWFSENERKAFMQCTPAGYRLVGVAGLIGLVGWVLFLVLVAVVILAGATRLFEAPTLWTFVLPVALGLIAFVTDTLGRSLAHRRRFQYYYMPDVATWEVDGILGTYPPGSDVNGVTGPVERPEGDPK
jgi:hypothetical protein